MSVSQKQRNEKVYVVVRSVDFETSRVQKVFSDVVEAETFAYEQAEETPFDREVQEWTDAGNGHVYTAKCKDTSFTVNEYEVR